MKAVRKDAKEQLELNRVINTSEVIGTVATPGGTCEVCASAAAGYDEAAGRLVVKLAAFLRTTNLRTKEKHLNASWLPKPETVTEAVAADEAGEVARDVFHRWTRKVRAAAPLVHSST